MMLYVKNYSRRSIIRISASYKTWLENFPRAFLRYYNIDIFPFRCDRRTCTNPQKIFRVKIPKAPKHLFSILVAKPLQNKVRLDGEAF